MSAPVRPERPVFHAMDGKVVSDSQLRAMEAPVGPVVQVFDLSQEKKEVFDPSQEKPRQVFDLTKKV